MAYFFPVVFSVPLFGRYLAQEWLWTFTPSLSYVGQGTYQVSQKELRLLTCLTGIIMGFPTALSMNLVCFDTRY